MNYDNKKAIDFFGEEIVEKIETQHQDGYPNIYKETYHKSFQYGDTSKYIVPFKNKKYEVTVVDNVLKHPLYINQIIDWKEIS